MDAHKSESSLLTTGENTQSTQSTQSIRNKSSWAFTAEFDSQGNDITELLKTFRIGHARIKHDHLSVIIGAVVDMSATLSGELSVSSVEAAQRFGLYYREIGLLFEKSNGWDKQITSSIYRIRDRKPPRLVLGDECLVALPRATLERLATRFLSLYDSISRVV